MTELILVAILGLAVLCLFDLRLGMGLTLLVGFLQDPLRKVVPDSPVYYSALVILFAGATFMGAMQTGAIRPFGAIPEWSARLRNPILLFVLLVIAQSIAAFAYTGSFFLAGIGLLVYLSPFPALLLAYSFASSAGRVHAFFWMYVAVSAAMVSGIYLTWLGFDWEILRSVGEPLVVYSLDTGEALELPGGFLRSPEVAAWHAASGVCVVLMLGLSEGRKDTGLVSVALVLFFVGAVMLTGRRKFLLEIAMFLPVLWFLLWRFKMATGRILYLLFALALAGTVVMVTGIVETNTRDAFQAPVARGQDRTDEILERVMNVTVGAVPYIIEVNGILGSGAGTGSGGAQYYGGGDEIVGGAAEGGLGKILAEIGVPGILLFFWLCSRFAIQVWRTLGLASKGPPEIAQLTMGIASFLAANAAVFANAHQVYSDPFILLLIGTCLGFILATHRLEDASLAERERERARALRAGARIGPRGFRP
jgi:hypothetical protein